MRMQYLRLENVIYEIMTSICDRVITGPSRECYHMQICKPNGLSV